MQPQKTNPTQSPPDAPQKQKQQQDHFPLRISIQPLRTSIAQSDTKTIYEKLVNYQSLNSHQKMVTVDNLPIMFDQLGKDGLQILNPLLNNIIVQQPSISSKLLGKIPDLISYINKYTNNPLEIDKQLKQTIIPIIIKYLNSQDIQTKQQAGRQLVSISLKLNQKDRGEYILKHVLLMSHDDGNQGNRLVAVQLLSSLSQSLGRGLCEQFIGLEFLSLGDDASQKVRKQAIKQLPIICKMISQHFFNYKILPFYYQKCQDMINWGIRKSCADIIIQITQQASETQRQNKLTQIMVKLTKDTNKWVRLSAYLNLGKFIYYLKGLQVHEKLFKRFLKMAQKQIINIGNQNQIPYNCAYNFPAVASVMGAQKWSEMNKTYQKLLKINDKRIKITLSQSLYEIAKIIGGKNTQKYLFKIMDNFLKDQNDDIKLGIIQNMSQIIFALNDQKRESMIGIFEQFQKNQAKWRIRQAIVKQCTKLLEIYSAQTVNLYIVPILISLCSDPVSIVRDQAAKVVYIFIQNFKNKENMKIGLIESFKAFATSLLYHHRLSFIKMCRYLMEDRVMFGKYFVGNLLQLKDDRVINVRLALAEFIRDIRNMRDVKKKQENKTMCNENQKQQNIGVSSSQLEKIIQQIYTTLKSDKAEQVRQTLQQQNI